MKNNILNTLRNYKFAVVAFTALLLAGGASAQAQTSYTSTTATTGWSAARWNNSTDGATYGSTYTANNSVSFTSGSYSFAGMGSALNVGNITLGNNVSVNFASINSTFGTSGAVRTITLGSGSTFDFNSQGMSTTAGTGIIISGSGVFGTGNYTTTANAQSFTINGGTVIARGTTGLGSGAASVLNLNGGTLASNGNRDFANTRFGGGIVIGGNMQFGELASNVALASSTANLSFANNVSLGSAVRTFTLGNDAVQTFSGIISNSSGGITFSANSGLSGAGRFDITGTANSFTGPINITAGEVRFSSNGSLGNAGNTVTVDGGRLGILGTAGTTVDLSSRSILLGSTAGTSISATGGVTNILKYDGVLQNKVGSNGILVKQGSGTLSLGGVSTYTGNTAIEDGILQLTGSNDRLPTGTIVSLGSTGTTLGTLDLNGLNQQVAGLVSATGSNVSTSLKNTVKSTVAATLDINVANGTITSYGAGTAANSGVIGGAISLRKSGLGTQVLGDANTYTGTTTIDAGTLAVNGSLLNSSVLVNAGGFLGGSGKVGAITGAGTVGPGNSPGILTATSVDPTAGTDFKFEFTSLSPTYTSATASGNDLLHLTASSSPFAGGTFTSGNIISIYLNNAAITTSLLAGNNTTFSGGFFVDGTYGLAAALNPASFAYYTTSATLGTGSAVDYNGISYYSLNGDIAAKTTLSDTAVTGAGFATGTVSGTLLTFTAVPEPSTGTLLAFGLGGLVLTRLLRRKQS